MKQTIEISTLTILKILGILAALVFLYLIQNILLMLFLAVIIAAAVDGPIDWLVRKKIPRGVAVALVYVFGIAILAGALYLIIPPLASQIKMLATTLPNYLTSLEGNLKVVSGQVGIINVQDILNYLSDRLNNAAGSIFVATINFFGGLFSALIVLIISIYLAVKESAVKKFVTSLVLPHQRAYTESVVDRSIYKLGAWFRGQVVLMITIGTMVFIALSILKIPFALTLALIAALLEIIPIIGPIIAAVPAILFALLVSPGLALLTAAVYYVIQELEKYLIVPQVMRRAIDLGSITVMVAVLIGAELHGIIGAVVAIPIAAIVSIIFRDIIQKRENKFKEIGQEG